MTNKSTLYTLVLTTLLTTAVGFEASAQTPMMAQPATTAVAVPLPTIATTTSVPIPTFLPTLAPIAMPIFLPFRGNCQARADQEIAACMSILAPFIHLSGVPYDKAVSESVGKQYGKCLNKAYARQIACENGEVTY